ncbi:Uncharacterized protein OS=Isosphaera pallida (strain ATCC 43644 / DSM 9630 / IS1B) GN=Isop_2506 PE=4 SV=1 [Gemmataceae bacterium]|nr:Uncharacterized protein OS=Isosphaera pallida (strain ATCC 43644 / DSM 9630 / IS1B) GN=Isop_2506 PE=4 SV=1 [Gemmataceae bacterium]VTT99399.1 Uncharacterized protein OS=Isosphaera pallida (strain ATCC 43644 / DSM 9630 / IS1B) GN=Isop_2506 PE=4 SV=1 [Gemmataceae bacterium]
MSHDLSLEPVLRAVEPAVRLVPERHLGQVRNYLIDTGAALPTSTKLPLWVSRADLEEAAVFPAHVLAGTEPALLLVTDPNDRMIERLPRDEQLLIYWEVLFEAAVMRAIDRKLGSGALAVGDCSKRLAQFGPPAAREVRYVLESEHLVSPGATDPARYRAFAATYLAAAKFAHHKLEDLFPSLPHDGSVERAISADVDAAALFDATRPAGAAAPHAEPPPDERWSSADPVPQVAAAPPEEPSKLLGRAAEAERTGNHVRAAILRSHAAATATGDAREDALAGARDALGKLVDALGDMFHWDADTRREWAQALGPVLDAAWSGVWPRAARCLYELQKIPADLSREVFAVDLAEAIRTLGRRPVKRPLPRAKPVLVLMGLRRAHGQLVRAALGPAAHLRVDRLFYHQLHELEHEIRRDLGPVVAAALADAGLVPANTVEEVARDKLVAELLDRVCASGYLRMGDLRDAIARNRLKMPDLRGPGEFVVGDPLLRADRALAVSLDGVYRRGEVYLRLLQRASSLFFATQVGRVLFLYLVLPCVGAFMVVIGGQEMIHIGEKVYGFAAKTVTGRPWPPPAPAPQPAPVPQPPPSAGPVVALPDGRATSDEVVVDEETGEFHWEDAPHPVNIVREVLIPSQVAVKKEASATQFHVPWDWVAGAGVFIFLMIHAPPFRRGVVAAARALWLVARGVVWDVPTRVLQSRVVRGVRLSRPVRVLRRYFWSPLLISGVVLGVAALFGANPRFLARWGWAVWAALTLAYNTPWGWVAQDRVAEAVSDWWRVIRVNLIPGLVATIIDWFRRLGNWVERKLYAVDERLRFRGGDSQGSLVAKALLGLAWFPVAYVFRFAFYLLIEPQVNPVKHFPVVTVSHKLLLPLVVSEHPVSEPSTLGAVLVAQMGWGVEKANFWAFWIVAGIPGVFGFIAWELLSNWRLYAANRPDRLRPVTLGSHGESMRGLLRPGFHSGTVPKLFRKLRTADRARAGRLHHDLEHAAEGVHRFVERELVHLLARCPDWGGAALGVGAVRLGCQRVTVELVAPALGRDPFVIGFENVGGEIDARVEQAGWAAALTAAQRRAFAAALRGVLDMAACDRANGEPRGDDAAPRGGDFGELTRRVSWAEWGGHWNAAHK